MSMHILVEPIDTLVEPKVGGLYFLRVVKLNIFTFCFILKLGKNNPVYHSKQTFNLSKNILNTTNSPPTTMICAYYYAQKYQALQEHPLDPPP